MNTLTDFLPLVNSIAIRRAGDVLFSRWVDAFASRGTIDFETGPTVGPDFEPTPEDEAAYLALVAETESREELMAEWAALDRLEDEAAAFSDPWDLMNPSELAECGGYHSANVWE